MTGVPNLDPFECRDFPVACRKGESRNESQLVRALKEVETGGKKAVDQQGEMGVSAATWYIWKKKYGGLEVNEAKRLKELEQPHFPQYSSKPDWNQLQARTARTLDALAQAQGLPSYEAFHQQHGVPFQSPSQNSGLGVQSYLKTQAARQSADFIREANSEPASKAQASRRASQPSDEPRFQSADEILSEVLSVLPVRQLPKSEYQNRDEDRKQDLWPKLQAGQVLNDNEMKQLFLTLDIQHYQAQTEKEKLEAELLRQYAEQKLAENLVSQASRDTDGHVLIGGVPVRPEDALYFARQDIQHFQDTDTHLRPDQLEVQEHLSGPALLDPGPLISTSRSPKILVLGKKEVIFMPPQVDLYYNVRLAQQHSPWDLIWFKKQVQKGGPWDYKTKSPLYENFGNFHYGIVGSAQGIPAEILKRAAGYAQLQDGSPNPKWGNPAGGSPYGDDPKDQYWIQMGVSYYKKYLKTK